MAEPNLCACGCGGQPKNPQSTYCVGHAFRGKGGDKTNKYRIYGSKSEDPNRRDVLSDVTRRRTASQQEAHQAALRDEIRDSLARRCPMVNVKDAA